MKQRWIHRGIGIIRVVANLLAHAARPTPRACAKATAFARAKVVTSTTQCIKSLCLRKGQLLQQSSLAALRHWDGLSRTGAGFRVLWFLWGIAGKFSSFTLPIKRMSLSATKRG